MVPNSTDCFIREYYQMYIELFIVLGTLKLLVENFTVQSYYVIYQPHPCLII